MFREESERPSWKLKFTPLSGLVCVHTKTETDQTAWKNPTGSKMPFTFLRQEAGRKKSASSANPPMNL